MGKAVGRPTIMTPQVLQKLELAFSYGCTDDEACFFADIAPATLYNYQKEYPEFTLACGRVEFALIDKGLFTVMLNFFASLSFPDDTLKVKLKTTWS